jgi:hypothetical protein
MKYDTAVVGGGLSGMIAAYELALAGESVILYEAAPELGGFAKSTGKDASFSEHSWRSYADFYTNLKDVVASIGLAWPSASVSLTPFPHVPFQVTKGDLKMLGRLLRGMATVSLAKYQTLSWYKTNIEGLSPWGTLALGRFNKSGSDYQDIPFKTVIRVVEMVIAHRAAFHIAPLPIQEYLIEPLQRKLEELGVDIRLNSPVKALSPEALDAHTVISAIPPSAYAKLDSSALYPFSIKKMNKLAAESQHQEISFRIIFNRRLVYPSRVTFDFHESAWGLLIVPCEMYHTRQTWSSSVWSGTCTYMRRRDRHGKLVTECSLQEFRHSVLDQLLECCELKEWFQKVHVDIRDALETLTDFTIWNAWAEGTDGVLQSSETMAVNSYRESWSRPMAGCKIGPKVFLAGAHAGTGCDMWLMESAAEAGKRAAINVLLSKQKDASRIFLDKHARHPIRFLLFNLGIFVSVAYLWYAGFR